MRIGWVLAALAVGLLVGYTAATLRLDRRAERWVASRDSLLTTIGIRDAELALMDAEAVRLRAQVGQRDTVRLPARRPVQISPDSMQMPPDVYSREALIDTLLREQGALHDRIGRDSVRLGAYARLVAIRDTQLEVVTGQRDSLRSLIVAAPVGQRGCKLLGLIPCPVVVVGYGASLADGGVHHGPAVTAGWQIRL